MTETTYDLIVIGAGVGGYVAAIRAAQLGMRVLSIDKRANLGGTCLNVGCIPSKALLYSSHKYYETVHHLDIHGIEISGDVKLNLTKFLARKDKVVTDLTKGIAYLFKKNKIDFHQGTASFKSPQEIIIHSDDQSEQIVTAPHILIASGSEVMPLAGVDIDEQSIVSSTGALSLTKVPDHLVVIGGGYIGLELGSVWQRLGAKVTVIEFQESIVPTMDQELSKTLHKSLMDQGINFKFSTKVNHVENTKSGLQVHIESAQNPTQQDKIACDVLLACAGRRPFTAGLNLDNIGIHVDKRGYIPVNEHYATAIPGVYAVGDVIQGPMLAHKAEEEAVAAIEHLAGQYAHVNYHVIPSVIYTYPEVASVGLTEEDLKKQARTYSVGKFPFTANSRAKPNGETDGFVKILADKMTDEVLGVHIIHAEAGTLIAEAALGMEFKASAEDIARTCHAHPTLNEALKEAALNVAARAIHI